MPASLVIASSGTRDARGLSRHDEPSPTIRPQLHPLHAHRVLTCTRPSPLSRYTLDRTHYTPTASSPAHPLLLSRDTLSTAPLHAFLLLTRYSPSSSPATRSLTCRFRASLKHKYDGQTKFIKPNSLKQDIIIKHWVSIGSIHRKQG